MELKNSDLIKVAKIAPKKYNRRELTGVHIDKENIVATDSYKMLICKHNQEVQEDTNITLNAQEVKKLDKKELSFFVDKKDINDKIIGKCIVGTSIEDMKVDYPKYNEIIPKHEPNQTIVLNAKLLIELLEAFKTKKQSMIKLEIRQDEDAIIIKGHEPDNNQFTGLLMPIRE
ncbi:MAG: hypothetical protein HQ536_05205 [Parcubacteria group bacterium]|nr:hypothetical protein [Parcubacteria group bacterium]